jgi:hypothetical protein
MFFANESPRYYAKKEQWRTALQVLAKLRGLSPNHDYIYREVEDMKDQVEPPATLGLFREMILTPVHRKRFLISIFLMVRDQNNQLTCRFSSK